MRHSTLFTIFLLVFTSCFSQYLRAEEAKITTAPVTVTTAQAKLQSVPALIEVVGTIQAVERATIAAKVTGVITKLPVVLGSRVKKADLLVVISADELKAQLSQAEAQLRQAKRNLDREKKLLKKNATTAETVKSMQDGYNVAWAAYQEVKTMLGYATITAPFDGVITKKSVHPGDLATPGATLLQIENDKHLQVITAVPESLLLTIKPGDTLEFTVPATRVAAQGVVAEIAPSADPTSRTAPVTLDIQANPNLRSGQFARVLLPGKASQSLFVPQKAVITRGQMELIFVAENNTAKLRLVRTGMEHGEMVEILSGLQPGAQVITSDTHQLVSGQPIKRAE
ncbi:MAG: efflux transporter periplasmic adaptor subunit [Desulfobulbus propionicus]|nr:MAG: efflux transporter periplasmic adaptor subunit [Desulfobulbus propionicus]